MSPATAWDWAGEPVRIADVERTLRRQREELAGSSGQPLMRASVANLVAVARSEHEGRRALRSVQELAEQAPSRCVVLVAGEAGQDEGVQAWACVHERPARSHSQVAWEQIVVWARVEPRSLASIVLPLLLPELPVFTWWLGTPPFDDDVLEALLGVTDRLVVDSAEFGEPGRDLVRMAQALWHIGPPPSDCAWGRLTPWREVLGGWFEGPPIRGAWDAIRRVRVDTGEVTEGLLLVGWLASRLRWRLLDARWRDVDLISRYSTETGHCAVALTQPADTGEYMQVDLTVAAEQGTATLRVRAAGEHLAGEVALPGADVMRRSFGAQLQTGSSALAGELEAYARDVVYEQALAAAARLADVSRR